MKTYLRKVLCLGLNISMASQLSMCTAVEESSELQASLSEFVYLRCNATSWNLDDTTRMKEKNGSFSLESRSYR